MIVRNYQCWKVNDLQRAPGIKYSSQTWLILPEIDWKRTYYGQKTVKQTGSWHHVRFAKWVVTEGTELEMEQMLAENE